MFDVQDAKSDAVRRVKKPEETKYIKKFFNNTILFDSYVLTVEILVELEQAEMSRKICHRKTGTYGRNLEFA